MTSNPAYGGSVNRACIAALFHRRDLLELFKQTIARRGNLLEDLRPKFAVLINELNQRLTRLATRFQPVG